MAQMGVAETKMGNVPHKTAKHILVADKTPGTEDITSTARTGDNGLTLTEMAPFGVVGAITPSTNPSETVICNSMGMIAAGNGVVFNPHPGAIATSNYAVNLVNRASAEAGGPKVLVASVASPTLQTADVMYKHPAVKLLVCTGGPGVVKSVLSSGKKAIGAGAGNPPVIVDDTADIAKAAKDIIDGCTFDNNLPCIAEKECFGFCLDIGHLLVLGLDSKTSMETLGDRVKALHIHDNDGFDDLHLAPYAGLNDWEKFLKGLISINYTGDLNFETPGSFNQVPPALMPSMMRHIAEIGKYFRARLEKTRAEKARSASGDIGYEKTAKVCTDHFQLSSHDGRRCFSDRRRLFLQDPQRLRYGRCQRYRYGAR
jgi:hypothetical protein